jgi:hypoxanthine-guanine phosphoribosyltransferase
MNNNRPATASEIAKRQLFCQYDIVHTVHQLARRISYEWRPTVLVPILNGGMPFAVDLLRCLYVHGCDVEVEPLRVKRMKDGNAELLTRSRFNFAGHHVLIVDDIHDSGGTAKLAAWTVTTPTPPASLAFAFMFARSEKKDLGLPGPTFVGHWLGDERDYLVGYGLDRNGLCMGAMSVYAEQPSDQVPDSKLI